MKRRNFVKNTVAASLGCMGFLSGNPLGYLLRPAHAATGKTLVVIFQRGGCDGLNTCVPYGDEDYYQLRPTIAIAPPKASNSASAIDLDGFFGLHPSLAALKPLYTAGDLAVLPTTHYPDSTHSHFDGQHFIESGAKSKRLDGWLNRYLASFSTTSRLRSVAFADILPQSLRGKASTSQIREFRDFRLKLTRETESKIKKDLGTVYSQPSNGDSQSYEAMLFQSGRTLLNDLDLITELTLQNTTETNPTSYPDSLYGRQLQQTAQLIKANLGLEIATLDIGGWDTHVNQGGAEAGGSQSRRHKEFADGIAAFYADLGGLMNDVVIMTCTEFGRTAKENASRGTDHGSASTWFVVGKSVQGGIYGQWPGLLNDQLIRERYLNFTIDYRDIMGDILTQHLGNKQLDRLLPGHNYSSVGLFT